jgi:hypothetical protein
VSRFKSSRGLNFGMGVFLFAFCVGSGVGMVLCCLSWG